MITAHQIFSKIKLQYPLLVWAIQLIIALSTVILFTKIIHPAHHNHYGYFWSWDGGWYRAIAREGYSSGFQATRAEVFFPLYPLLINLVHRATDISFKYSAFWISNISLLLALVVLYQLMLDFIDKKTAQYSLWLLTLFPMSLFFHCAYTESLNLLFLVLFFYCIRQNHWYCAILSAYCATLTHDLGVILIFSALICLWKQRQQLSTTIFICRLLSTAMIPLGIFTYILYLYIHTGNPLVFFQAFHTGTRKVIVIPIYHALKYLVLLSFHPRHSANANFVSAMNAICVLVMSIMSVLMLTCYRDKVPLEQKVFFIISFLISTSVTRYGSVESLGRYLSVLFPGFIIWASCCQRQTLWIMSLFILAPLKVILLGMSANIYWIT